MLNEFDIKDWVCVGQPTKLYDVKRNQLVSLTDEPGFPFWFEHVDGMYSYCKMLDGTVFHPAAWSDVFVWKEKAKPFTQGSKRDGKSV